MSEAICLPPAISSKNRYHPGVARVTTSRTEKVAHFSSWPGSRIQDEAIDDIVRQLLARWRKETVHISSISEIVEHPCYQNIIRLGWPAVPQLIRELIREPDFLFDALYSITGSNPLLGREDVQGDLAGMASVWIDWARQRGIRYGQ